jgi:hypothetical protein
MEFALELLLVIGMIGGGAIPSISKFLEDKSIGWSFRCTVVESLMNTKKEKQYNEVCIDIIIKELEKYYVNSYTFNGILIKALCEMEGKKASKLIEQAVIEDEVDFEYVTLDQIEKLIGYKINKL